MRFPDSRPLQHRGWLELVIVSRVVPFPVTLSEPQDDLLVPEWWDCIPTPDQSWNSVFTVKKEVVQRKKVRHGYCWWSGSAWFIKLYICHSVTNPSLKRLNQHLSKRKTKYLMWIHHITFFHVFTKCDFCHAVLSILKALLCIFTSP
jgi:hypothetical protein